MPRKKPYSGKKKKVQLREKKNKREGSTTRSNSTERWNTQDTNDRRKHSSDASSNDGGQRELRKDIGRGGRSVIPKERYRLTFLRESKDEIARRKAQSQTEVLHDVKPEEMEMGIEEVYVPGSELDMPQRPAWEYGESKEKVEWREEQYFSRYLDDIYSKFQDKNLSYFEHNLETWRQIWRVFEMSDIIALLADARHPVLHFSPALYNYATQTANKPLILILNKIDLVPAPVVVAWKSYFQEKFPQLHVITFTSFPKNVRGEVEAKQVRKRRPVGKRVYTTQIGPQDLLQVCKQICGDKVNLDSWEEKIKNDLERLKCDLEEGPDHTSDDATGSGDFNTELGTEELFKNGRLTLGFVGHPNVGKSSVMNGLIGKKVVSTSVTPGHTKYFQTYFLTPTVMLCDCPGLVFPSLVDKQMQILSGIYPIAQVQEPYTPVGYLASRIPVVKLLGVVHPNFEGRGEVLKWTAWDVCEAWAEKRGFYTAKGGRHDVYRAANHILRMAVDGRLCMFMLPPGYIRNEREWIANPDTAKLVNLTSDPGKVSDWLSFHARAASNEFESSEHDSDDTSPEDSGSSQNHGDSGRRLTVENKFALLGEE